MTNDLLSIIKNASTWWDVYSKLSKQNIERNPLVGKLFEEFCKCYYLLDPLVKNEYRNVWFFSEIPQNIKTRLNLGKIDHGIDLVLEGVDGTLSVVQCKFRNNQNGNISWTKDNLANLFADGDKADYFIVFTNASGLDKHSLTKKENQLKLVTLGDLLDIPPSTFNKIKNHLTGISSDIQVTKKEPRDDQLKAIQAVIDGFKQQDRGQLILPCGAGKTLVSLWIKEVLSICHTLVLVPSLALLRQIKNEWAINSERFIPYICVCSEKDIDKGVDQQVVHTYEISGKVSTNVSEVREFLNSHNETIVYSTYQSLGVICDAIKESTFEFDLAICDEAHKTSGSKCSKFGAVHSNANIAIKKRLYMTATPRILSESVKSKLSDEIVKYIYDMSNPEIFGSEFYRMSFREAIDKQILVDYKIIAIGVSDEELCHAINQRKYISETETIDEIANNYALEKFMQLHGPTHAITFHSSVKKAKEFQTRHIEFYQETTAFHVNGQLTTNERNIRMKEFEQSPKAVMTNARCLTEGVDVPAIDIVYFCDPKNSKIDIVQAAGRTLRRADYKGKQFGYIVVPIFHQDKNNLEEVINDSPFKNLINIIGALCSQDERLVDELKQIKLGKGQRSVGTAHVAIEDFCNLITVEGFDEHLKNNLFFQGIGNIRVPWKLFTDAKSFVHSLNLKTGNDWFIYCKSGNKPDDIPVKPHQVYKNKGWVSMGDWLGTGIIACQNRIYQSLNNATQFVHQLNLKTINDWFIYCKSGDKPDDIPANPVIVYKNKGWISWGEWLGTGVISNQNKIYRAFEDAREFTHQLRLKSSSEWMQYCKIGNKPDDIPTSPLQTYSDKGWVSWGDWLGTGVVANQRRIYLPFEQARMYVRDLGLKNRHEWKVYALSEKRPNNIPAYPDHVYKENGWISLSDWLGKSESYQNRIYWPYDKAKQFVHALGIKTYNEWQVYCKSGNKPEEIPSYPRNIYRNNGWISTGDWLGTGVIANQSKEYLSFEDARNFVHRLGLKSLKDWKIFSESGKKPENIPKHPHATYKHKGWKSIKDWVGMEIITFLSFNEARIFVHQLAFKSEFDWRIYCKSGKKPKDIPATPSTVYKNKGWKSMGDWLGTDNVAPKHRAFLPFDEARAFVHQLGLKNESNWRDYCKSGKKSENIPAYPNESYKNKGWKAMGDWLGTRTVANRDKSFLSFNEARAFVHQLGLKSWSNWRNYCKRGQKPKNIPACPNESYKNKGWKSMSDWLGTK